MNRFENALIYAINAHSGQVRKNAGTPYILHPLEAAAVAAMLTDDEDVLIAILLHDTVEDTDVTYDDIKREFGQRIADFVAGETEDKREGTPKNESWYIRKVESLEHLKNACREVKIMWLADKVSNMRSFCNQYRKEGSAMWRHYNQHDVKLQEWYYRTIADYVSEFKGTEAYEEYIMRLDMVFKEDQ